MIAEVRFGIDASTGAAKDSVTLNEAIKLYINHRPVLGVGKRVIANAVGLIAAAIGRDGADSDSIPWRDLLSVLTSTGEVSQRSTRACFRCTPVFRSFHPHQTEFYCFCDRSVREKAWRSRKRVAQAKCTAPCLQVAAGELAAATRLRPGL